MEEDEYIMKSMTEINWSKMRKILVTFSLPFSFDEDSCILRPTAKA